MFQRSTFSAFSALWIHREPPLRQSLKSYAPRSNSDADETNLEVAREWYRRFNKSTIPVKIATTTFARSSGPGGQKTNKTDSKAITTWPIHDLLAHIPKVLHQELRASRHYVSSSDSIAIHCDSDRSQTKNKEITHERLIEEITRIYKKTVPGVTSAEQKQRVEKIPRKNLAYNDANARQHKLMLKQETQSEKRKKFAQDRQKAAVLARAKKEAAKEAARTAAISKKGKARKK